MIAYQTITMLLRTATTNQEFRQESITFRMIETSSTINCLTQHGVDHHENNDNEKRLGNPKLSRVQSRRSYLLSISHGKPQYSVQDCSLQMAYKSMDWILVA